MQLTHVTADTKHEEAVTATDYGSQATPRANPGTAQVPIAMYG